MSFQPVLPETLRQLLTRADFSGLEVYSITPTRPVTEADVKESPSLQAALAPCLKGAASVVLCEKADDKTPRTLLEAAFEQIVVSSSGDLLRLELHVPRKEALDAFSALLARGEADPLLVHFFFERTAPAEDLTGVHFYRYEPEEGEDTPTVSTKLLPFLERNFSHNCEYALDVSGYTLAELNTDPFVRFLAAHFPAVVLMAFPAEDGYRKLLKLRQGTPAVNSRVEGFNNL